MIFMLLSSVWGLTQKMKRNFEHLVRKHDHERVAEWFLNSKKTNKVWKWRDLSRSPDIICGDYGKNLRRFRTICHVRPLQTKASPKKNHSVENDPVRFRVKVTVKLGFDFKTFCIGNRQHRLVHVEFWEFFVSVW